MPDSGTATFFLQACLDRLKGGDDRARAELLEHACSRFRRLAALMIKDYSRVRRWADTDDVLQGALVRIWRALADVQPADVQPADVRGLCRLAAVAIRRELIDICRHYFGPQGIGTKEERLPTGDSSFSPQDFGQADSTQEPARLQNWTEFHEQVNMLSDPEREVFDLIWYQGLTQKEVAELLQVSVPTVKLRWQSARLELHHKLKEQRPV